MNAFDQVFLNEDWEGVPDAPRFYLSAFGKHPGWRDHLDDIGLATASLVEARGIIYGGIAHQVENATWEKVGADRVSPGFEHVLHWRRMNESMTGLIWSSHDGKGRSLYPMIALAHCIAQPFGRLVNDVLPRLKQVEAKCRKTSSASEVIAIFDQAQQALRDAPVSAAGPDDGSNAGLAAWTAYFSSEQVGLRRVMHHLLSNFALFAPGSQEWYSDETPIRSRTLRLPQIPGIKPMESLNAWMAFIATQIDPAVPLLGLLPAGGKWLDLIVGQPTVSDFYLLRALPAGTPLVTDIPYQLDVDELVNDEKLFEQLGNGQLPLTSCLNGNEAEASRDAAAKWLARFRPSARPSFFSRLFKQSGS